MELARRAGAREGATVEDRVGGRSVRVQYDAVHRSASAAYGDGTPLPATTLFWFAWYAFHPDTEVFRAN